METKTISDNIIQLNEDLFKHNAIFQRADGTFAPTETLEFYPLHSLPLHHIIPNHHNRRGKNLRQHVVHPQPIDKGPHADLIQS